jgi:hypothetical protein
MAGVIIPKDAYPVMRVGTEFFMRGVDILGEIQDDNLVSGLVFMTLWHLYSKAGSGTSRQAIGIRELARLLAMSYETVRRHAQLLVDARQCTLTDEGLRVSVAALRRRPKSALLRKSYLNTERLLRDLQRIGYLKPYASEKARPSDRTSIAIVGAGRFLEAVRESTANVGGDLVLGLVYAAIWTANVKHVTSTGEGSYATLVPDSERTPVSVMAIAASLRQPYETIRRYANALVARKAAARVGRQGLIVPVAVHGAGMAMTQTGYRIIGDIVRDLQRAGIRLERA